MIIYKSGEKIGFPSAVMLGMFDGLHLGHKKLAETAKAAAAERGLKTVLYTFSQNPKSSEALITNEKKISLCGKMGIDCVFFENFTEDFKKMPPDDFIGYIKDTLNGKCVITGFDYRFGFMHKGSVSDLKNRGFDLFVVPEVKMQGEKVSSSAIKKYIKSGEVDKADMMLGYSFSFDGTVLKGRSVGRRLGFRTANIKPPEGIVMPKDGVYATKTYINGECYNSVTNIGRNPTFNLEKTTVETHILGFDGELYGQKIEIAFLKFIRGEIRFSSEDELSLQIASDIKSALSAAEDCDVYKR